MAIDALRQVQQTVAKAALEDNSLFDLLPLFTGLVARDVGALVRIERILQRRGTQRGSATLTVVIPRTEEPLEQSSVERDIISALTNMQVRRQAAVTAVRTAVVEGVALEFEPLFRRSWTSCSRNES